MELISKSIDDKLNSKPRCKSFLQVARIGKIKDDKRKYWENRLKLNLLRVRNLKMNHRKNVERMAIFGMICKNLFKNKRISSIIPNEIDRIVELSARSFIPAMSSWAYRRANFGAFTALIVIRTKEIISAVLCVITITEISSY